MKALFAATGMMLATCSFAYAESITAQCSLDVDGKNVWNDKCCVETTAQDDGSTGFLAELHAESWRGCAYERNILATHRYQHINRGVSGHGLT